MVLEVLGSYLGIRISYLGIDPTKEVSITNKTESRSLTCSLWLTLY